MPAKRLTRKPSTRETGIISVLFLCSANSCRSQIAEGLLRHRAADRFDAQSAGTHATSLNPMAAKTMEEIGIDISAQRSKPVDAMLSRKFDYVITVCDNAKNSCPIPPAAGSVLHWDIEDPAEAQGTEAERREVFLRVRKKLEHLIAEFIRSHSQ
jgi:arsenate reductase (thioredoxin)